VGVVSEVEKGSMDQKRMKGLTDVNYERWEWWADGWKLEHNWALG
jgi:hypothetical protein